MKEAPDYYGVLFFPSGDHTPALPGLPGDRGAAPAADEDLRAGDMPARLLTSGVARWWLLTRVLLVRFIHARGVPWRQPVLSRPGAWFLRGRSARYHPVYAHAGNFAQGPEHAIRGRTEA